MDCRQKYGINIEWIRDVAFESAWDAKKSIRRELHSWRDKRKVHSIVTKIYRALKRLLTSCDEETSQGLLMKLCELAWRGCEGDKAELQFFKWASDG